MPYHVSKKYHLTLVATCLTSLQVSTALSQTDIGDSGGIEEIIVTASKRPQPLRDIPASVSALTESQMDDLGAQSLQDYIQFVPGAVFNSYMPGRSHVVLRGIATTGGNDQGQGTVGYYINDVPLTEPGWSIVVPDIDTFDVNRVEVLRGPQGTLFGSGSLGGVVNYVANTAEADTFDGELEATANSTKNADVGYNLKGMINVPLVQDTLAARFVMTHREDAGYLDNIGTGKDGANTVTVDGGRMSLVWNASNEWTFTWLSLLQNTDAEDASFRLAELDEFERSSALPETVETDVTVHSVRADGDLGFATLTAVASYQEKEQDWIIDYTSLLSAYNSDLALNLSGPLYIHSGGETEGSSIEIRLTSRESDSIEWLVGGMMFDTDKSLYETIGAAGASVEFDNSALFGPGSGAIIAPDGSTFNGYYSEVEGTETALFGEVSWHLTDALTLTAGGRWFDTEISTATTQVGFSTYPGDPIFNKETTQDDGFTPKFAVEYAFSDDLKVYGLVSEGFRFGQPNNIPPLAGFTTPDGSASDSLTNYEVGIRSKPMSDLVVDATLFYVDWQDIQIRLQRPDFYNYSGNGGGATSQGAEITAQWQPADALSISTSVTYTDAALDDDMVIPYYGTASAGSPLPGSSDWAISSSVSYQIAAPFEPKLYLSYQYLSEGISDLSSYAAGAANTQGGYNLFNARLSMVVGRPQISLFADNLLDERGVTYTQSEANGLGEGILRPRTLGVTVNLPF